MIWHVIDVDHTANHVALIAALQNIEDSGGTIFSIIWRAKDGSPWESGAITRHFVIIYTTNK